MVLKIIRSVMSWHAGSNPSASANSLLKNRVTSNSYRIATEKFRRFESCTRNYIIKIYEVYKWLKDAIIIFYFI